MRMIVFQVIILFILTGCARDNRENEPVNNPTVLTTNHFIFNYTSLDRNNIQSISDTLESNWQRIVTNLSVADMPIVTITFYESPEALREGVRDIVPNLPLWATGLATGVSQVHMLSPSHPSQNFDGMVRNTVHEFAHCVTLKINSSIANNPRWLWESVAIHQAGQFVNPGLLTYMTNHSPPPFSELNSFSNTYIYSVGYLFSEFIVSTWGYTKLVELIESNGNTQSVFGLTQNEFYDQWFDFVKAKYEL